MRRPDGPSVLWWGRFDPDYSRNRILRGLLAGLGCSIGDFRPRASALGDLEAALRRVRRPDLVWVPCFRQRDLAAARRWSAGAGTKLLADPLISAYDKRVNERARHAPGSAGAARLRAWEGRRLRAADLVLADTEAHAAYFAATFGLPEARVAVVHVGAEEGLFVPRPVPPPAPGAPLEVLFFGSFIALQGPEVIVEAARRYRGPPVRWTLLGDGPLRARCEAAARGVDSVAFEPPLPYAALPARIHRAHLLLGIFGGGDKAGRVIPNKVYQALACARPLVTRRSAAYPPAMLEDPGGGVAWVAADDASALADAVRALAERPGDLARLGERAHAGYRRWLSNARVRAELVDALARLDLSPPEPG